MFSYTKLIEGQAETSDPFGNLVPWISFITPNIVLNKDGSVMAAFSYEGEDIEGHEQYEVDQIANSFEQASRSFREGVTIWSIVDRRRTYEYPEGDFPSDIGQYMDNAWREQFFSRRQLRNTHYLFVSLDAPEGSNALLERVWHLQKTEGMSFMKAAAEATKAYLFRRNLFAFEAAQIDQQVATLEEILNAFIASTTVLSLKRLELTEYLGALYARCNPPYAESDFSPAYIEDFFLDSYLPAHTLTRPDMKTLAFHGVEDSYCTALGVKAWPNGASVPSFLEDLLAMPGELVISQVFRFTNRQESEKYIKMMQRYHDNAKKSIGQHLRERFSKDEGADPDGGDEGRVILAQDAADAQSEITALGRVYGYHNLTVLCYGATQEESSDLARETQRALAARNFISVSEQENLLQAWAGTMPGQWGTILRWFMVSNANLADLFPLLTISSGSPVNHHLTEMRRNDPRVVGNKVAPALAVMPTRFSTPYYFNTHVGDVAHTIIVGPTGSGKSVIANWLISQWQKYVPSRTIIFDKNFSCRNATLLQDGTHINIGDVDSEAAPIQLNPLHNIKNVDERAYVREWLQILMTTDGKELPASDLNIIWEALVAVADEESPQLSSLPSILPKHLGERLSDWVGDGARAKYFDHAEDAFELSTFTTFEMGRLFDNPRVAAAFLDYAFHRIEQQLDGTPTLIYLEECKFLLDNAQFARRLDEWLRTLRKLNCFVVMATQGLNEIAKSELFSTIVDNVPNRIFLPNANAFASEELYRDKFGLNASQLNQIRIAIAKRDYIIVQPGTTRVVELQFPREIIACIRSDTKANALFDRHYQTRSITAKWKENYLTEILR
ncbi:MAG: hypothetical protein LW865_01570 [Betaproteobacteria bacterium]|jgi:type IV secretion/conjugal transfer VirB4 family ATPase|nr:hypothetical protein [Betaproteobacteria bacterium]